MKFSTWYSNIPGGFLTNSPKRQVNAYGDGSEITDSGESMFVEGDSVTRTHFLEQNELLVADGLEPAKGRRILLGITKASLSTESFISAASFQDTTRILTDAATLGKADVLKGFKENVIMGHLIPAGTGIEELRRMKVVKDGVSQEKEEAGADESQTDKLASAKAMLSLD